MAKIKGQMIDAFWSRHAESHTEDSYVFLDNLILAAIEAGWLAYDPVVDTVTWLGPIQIFSTEEHQLEKA